MYNEESIQSLKPMEHIRRRPALYLTSDTASGRVHEVLFHALDYPLNNAFEKRCDHIKVTIHDHNRVSVEDNGEGMKVAIHKYQGVSELQLDLSEFPTPGRARYFRDYDIRLTNAYSDMFTAEVRRDGYLWRQEYHQGEKVTEVIQVRPLTPDEGTGTTITFTPDFTILEPNDFDYDIIAHRLRELAFVIAGLSITLRDERNNREETFHAPDGLRDFVAYLNTANQPLHDIIHASKQVEVKPQYSNQLCDVKIEFALQYTDTLDNRELGFANTSATPKGTHLTSFRAALTRSINQFARKTGSLTEKDRNFTRSEIARGLTAVFSIYYPYISLKSLRHIHVLNPEIRPAMMRAVSETLMEYPEAMQRIIDQCVQRRAAIDRK